MYEYKIKELIKVVDGDTIDVIIDVGFDMYRKERVRINRVDTPESRTNNEQEKLLGIEAKNFISQWLINQNQLKIKTFKDDKYGRILGEIYGDNGDCLNDILIRDGYAWEYDGGEKLKDIKLLLERRKK